MSAAANQETAGGTMKNVIDDQSTQPKSHTYAENESHPNTNQEQKSKDSGASGVSSSYANQESPGGTLKNVIDDQSNKPQSHKYAENQSNPNSGQNNNKCGGGGPDHKQGQNNCDNCTKK